LPEVFKQLFLKALKQGSEGKTPDPFDVPPPVLKEAGFKTESELIEPQLESEPEEIEDDPSPAMEKFKKPQPKEKTFVDILADKIADRILKKLLGSM